MVIVKHRWPTLMGLLRMAALLLLVGSASQAGEARAARFMFRAYGEAEGLRSTSGRCFAQVPPGYILVCSDEGVFSYDGRRFDNLGPAQGLDQGVVEDIQIAGNGRVAVRYPDELFVSDQPVTTGRAPTALSFKRVDLHDPSLFDRSNRQMAADADGFAVIVGRRTMRVAFSPTGEATLRSLDLSGADEAAIAGPSALFAAAGGLWETFDGGRICSIRPVRCFSEPQGLSKGPWYDMATGPDGTALARSPRSLATIDPRSGSVHEEALPFQGGLYDEFASLLGLFRTPDGRLLTQSSHGLIERDPEGWRELGINDGVPDGPIAASLVDADGQLWLDVYGGGVFRGLDFGLWENFTPDDGLSKGDAWQVAGSERSALWVSTDATVDELRRVDGRLRVVKVIAAPGFSLAEGPDGRVWNDGSVSGALAIDRSTGRFENIFVPAVTRLAADAGHMWFGTRSGLFHEDFRNGAWSGLVADGFCGRVNGLASDRQGGVWLLCNGRLWHRHADGRLLRIGGVWPSKEFFPLDLWPTGAGRLWLAGAGGLFDATVVGDRLVTTIAVDPKDLQTSEIVAVTVDHRGWLWVGSDRGFSVFDGRRWLSRTSANGLLWDDLSESGIHEDPDGSMWIGTARGLSHVPNPAALFVQRPVRIVVSEAALGSRMILSGRVRYSRAPLRLRFGVLSYAAEQSVMFRYRLSGVDEGWAESSSGVTRYPSIPPGHHVLTVVGFDPLTHVTSAPVTMTIDMRYPWWRNGWIETLYAVVALALLYAAVRARDRAVERRQHQKQWELQDLVEERTREMRMAQAELRRLAALDALTGLLTRREVQTRLMADLASGAFAGATLVAMVDIDHFKRINDRYGHLAGDEVLCAIGARITGLLRDAEYAGRYGGEELMVVLNDQDGDGAKRISRLHRSIRETPFGIGDGAITVTCSIGLTWVRGSDDWASLVGRADAALYEAKSSGRDRVVERGALVDRPVAGVRLPAA